MSLLPAIHVFVTFCWRRRSGLKLPPRLISNLWTIIVQMHLNHSPLWFHGIYTLMSILWQVSAVACLLLNCLNKQPSRNVSQKWPHTCRYAPLTLLFGLGWNCSVTRDHELIGPILRGRIRVCVVNWWLSRPLMATNQLKLNRCPYIHGVKWTNRRTSWPKNTAA